MYSGRAGVRKGQGDGDREKKKRGLLSVKGDSGMHGSTADC